MAKDRVLQRISTKDVARLGKVGTTDAATSVIKLQKLDKQKIGKSKIAKLDHERKIVLTAKKGALGISLAHASEKELSNRLQTKGVRKLLKG